MSPPQECPGVDPPQKPSASLVDLPEELMLKILGELHNDQDLFACKATCRMFATFIMNDVRLRYRVQLVVSALVDGQGNADELTPIERLEAILKVSPEEGALPLVRFWKPPPQRVLLARTGGVLVYTTEERDRLELYRPSWEFARLPERRFMCTAWRNPAVLGTTLPEDLYYTVDLGQDLLILTRSIMTESILTYEHRLFSLSMNSFPHPDAAQNGKFLSHHLRGPRGSADEVFVEHSELTVFHDLLVEQFVSEYGRDGLLSAPKIVDTLIQVVNWRTGAVVWRYMSLSTVSCQILDESHIIVISCEAIRVFKFDPDIASCTCGEEQEALCMSFPIIKPTIRPWARRVKAFLSRPQLHPDDRPLFYADPARQLLVVAMTVQLDKPHPERDTLLFLVPLSTIRRYLPDGYWQAATIRPYTVRYRWELWGPNGSRVVQIASRSDEGHTTNLSLDVSGSRCVVGFHTRDFLVFDVHPRACHLDQGQRLQRGVAVPNSAGRGPIAAEVLAADVLKTEHLFRGPLTGRGLNIDTRFPCRMSRVRVPDGEDQQFSGW